MSGQLKQAATCFYELPDENRKYLEYYRMIITSLYALEHENKNAYPTFIKTVKAVAEKHGVDENETREALQKLVDDGYITQYVKKLQNKPVKLLKTDYKRAKKDGLLNPEDI